MIIADLVNRQNIWMIERDYGVRFLLKPLEARSVARKTLRQEFERGFATRENVSSQIDFTYSAGDY